MPRPHFSGEEAAREGAAGGDAVGVHVLDDLIQRSADGGEAAGEENPPPKPKQARKAG